METGILVNVSLPVHGEMQHQGVGIHVDPNIAFPDDAANLVHSLLQQSHDSVKRQAQSLKRRRTDDDVQRDRHDRANEEVDFSLAGINSRMYFRMKRSKPLDRTLERFAELKGKEYGNLKLFYGGRYVSPGSSADDVSRSLLSFIRA